MGYRVSTERMNEILTALSDRYQVYGPRWDAQKKRVQYAQVRNVGQIVYDRQSDFSPKAAFYPVSQVMFSFREDGVEEQVPADERGILIFARACDLNAIRRQDALFLKNGGAEDLFYKRMRERVKFVLMECAESFENCFCASLGTNVAEEYAMAVRFGADDLLVQVKDAAFADLFAAEEEVEFTVRFIEENRKKLRIPDIRRENLKEISDLPFWSMFDDQCIGCGGCNTVCGTCTCFDTVDVVYTEGGREGERRRVWSGCMLEDFTETAGGVRARKTRGANMRFKVFHKFYDYQVRFGEQMCVGCGRCDIRCPKEISFFDTVCELHDEIEEHGLAAHADSSCVDAAAGMDVIANRDPAASNGNIMKPEPHRILKIVQETKAEFTFRVEFSEPGAFGQFCMLSVPKVGEAPISISGTGDGWVEFTIRKVGRLTDGVFELREGSMLYLRGPYGHPWPVEEFEGPDQHLVVISGGTGLAPVRTMLNHFCEHPDKIASVHLIAGFKDLSGVLFDEDRARWAAAEKFRTIYTLDEGAPEGAEAAFETGMVTAHIDRIPFVDFGGNYHVAIVGPPPMMHFTALACLKRGVPEDRIWVSFERKMQCAVGKCGHCKINETYVCLEGPVLHYPKARTLFD